MMNLNELTPEERKVLAREALEQEKEAEKAKQEQRKVYKSMTAEKVTAVFPSLMEQSTLLQELKKHIYDEFQAALEMKYELYDTKESQQSHTFMSVDGMQRVTLGYYTTDDYDDTVNSGIEIVREYLSGLAHDDNSRVLVSAVMKLLSKDKKGTLKPSRVIQLRQMANESGDDRFLEGVKIIEAAYSPAKSKMFVKAEQKNGLGAWVSVPLGMTEA
ncbi:hypothetical protein FACS1894199_11410 [Bacteroidia bacterium]|nr:hypothetical protein FACS1894199_11410 [Bacteroidia bacterium]